MTLYVAGPMTGLPDFNYPAFHAAARKQGRKAIGVELEERYCEIAARRLDQRVMDFEGAS